MREIKFPDKREPTALRAEIGFHRQPPASAHPGEIFEEAVEFWCYPYAKLHNSLSPRVTDLELAPRIPNTGEFFHFVFEWIYLGASDSDDSDVRPFKDLEHHCSVNGKDAQEYDLDGGKFIEFRIPLDHVPRCGDYRIQATLNIVETTSGIIHERVLERGNSNIVRVS